MMAVSSVCKLTVVSACLHLLVPPFITKYCVHTHHCVDSVFAMDDRDTQRDSFVDYFGRHGETLKDTQRHKDSLREIHVERER